MCGNLVEEHEMAQHEEEEEVVVVGYWFSGCVCADDASHGPD